MRYVPGDQPNDVFAFSGLGVSRLTFDARQSGPRSNTNAYHPLAS
jgi:hypothetical protein